MEGRHLLPQRIQQTTGGHHSLEHTEGNVHDEMMREDVTGGDMTGEREGKTYITASTIPYE